MKYIDIWNKIKTQHQIIFVEVFKICIYIYIYEEIVFECFIFKYFYFYTFTLLLEYFTFLLVSDNDIKLFRNIKMLLFNFYIWYNNKNLTVHL